MIYRKLFPLLTFFTLSVPALAIEDLILTPDSTRLRHEVEWINTAQSDLVLSTTWPVRISLSYPQLQNQWQTLCENNNETPLLCDAVNQHLQNATKNISAELTLANQGQFFPGFAESFDASNANIVWDQQQGSWQWHAEATVRDDAERSPTGHLDGSFISWMKSDWRIGVGSPKQWWGPGWQSGLILSTHARPTPGLFINYYQPTAFQSVFLNWLGPVQVVSFLNQLESERTIVNPFFWGFRFTAKPKSWLELGLSRTAMWGGEGRDKGLDVFWDVLIGDDNQVGPGTEQPGNQLGGFDIKMAWEIAENRQLGFYTEWIGEDEAGGLPSKPILLAGTSFAEINSDGEGWRIIFEVSDTAVDPFSDSEFDVAYEHSIDTTGYRYYGRSMGSSFDSDSRTAVLIGQWYLNSTQSLGGQLGFYQINRDGSARENAPFQNANEMEAVKIWYEQEINQFTWRVQADALSELPENTYGFDERWRLLLAVKYNL
ncbi:MAG: capsule assembly Wzi family protein [Pseudomonadota bacterium]